MTENSKSSPPETPEYLEVLINYAGLFANRFSETKLARDILDRARDNFPSAEIETEMTSQESQVSELDKDEFVERLERAFGEMIDQHGDLKTAKIIIDRLVELDPVNTEYLQNQGFCMMNLGQHEEAQDVFGKVLAFSPTDISALLNCGACSQRLGKKEEAFSYLEKAEQLAPEHPGVLKTLIIWKAKDKDYDSMQEHAKTLIDQGREQDIVDTARDMQNQGFMKPASVLLKKVLRSNPDNPLANNNLGVIFYIKSKAEADAPTDEKLLIKAKEHFQKAVAQEQAVLDKIKGLENQEEARAHNNNVFSGFYSNAGLASFYLGQKEEAKEELHKSVQRNDKNYIPHIYLSRIYLEEEDSARAAFDHALAAEQQIEKSGVSNKASREAWDVINKAYIFSGGGVQIHPGDEGIVGHL